MRKRRKDIAAAGIILAAACGLLLINRLVFGGPGPVYGEVYLNGAYQETVLLTKDRRFSLPERPAVLLEVKDGGIAFTQSDCPDQICVRSGFLSHAGQTASCLPNQMTIRVSLAEPGPDEVDTVVGAAVCPGQPGYRKRR